MHSLEWAVTEVTNWCKANGVEITHQCNGEFTLARGNGEVYLYTPFANDPNGDTWDWSIGHMVLIPGVRTFPNGDPGFPDDHDYVEDHLEHSLERAMARVWEVLMNQQMAADAERLATEAMAECFGDGEAIWHS